MSRLAGLIGRTPRNPRVMLVPDQWSGSVQEYYHFILGYLATVTLWLHRHPGVPVSVRDCGPMNPWFALLPGAPDIEIMSPGDMLHLAVRRDRKRVVLKGLDDPSTFDTSVLSAFRRLLLAGVQAESAAPSHVTVVDRQSSGAFNATPAAEVPASGQAVRSTPNLPEAIRPALTSLPEDSYSIVDAAHVAPIDQLRLFSRTKVLIGQHGAGLTNMLWMPPGGVVVEILPPVPEYIAPIFGNLAAACGHHHFVVDQAHDHADVDAAVLQARVTTALSLADLA